MTARWEHHDLIQKLRADEMLASKSEADPELRWLHRQRETLLDEVARMLRTLLPQERSA